MPTSCAPATVTLNGESASFTPTGCENVPFTPSVSAVLENRQRAVPSGATVTLSLPPGDSHVKRAEIVLPEGTTLSPGVANGLAGLQRRAVHRPGLPGRRPGGHGELRHAAARHARRQGLLRRRVPALRGGRRARRAGQARRRRQAQPGHGPDHDDLRQPAAGAVHGVRAELRRRPEGGARTTRRRAGPRRSAPRSRPGAGPRRRPCPRASRSTRAARCRRSRPG